MLREVLVNISFTSKQSQYIASQVEQGDYQNASEVVRDALRLHEVYRHRVIEDLRAEIQKGLNSPMSDKSVKGIIAARPQVFVLLKIGRFIFHFFKRRHC